MNREALFCDGTGDYVIPAEPEINEKVVLRFRTAHNDVDEVKLHAGEQTYTLWKMQTTGNLIFMRSNISWELSRSAIILRSRKEQRSVISAGMV